MGRKWKFHSHTADTNTDYDNDAIDADAADDIAANDTDANDINDDDVTMMLNNSALLMFVLLMMHDHEPNPSYMILFRNSFMNTCFEIFFCEFSLSNNIYFSFK